MILTWACWPGEKRKAPLQTNREPEGLVKANPGTDVCPLKVTCIGNVSDILSEVSVADPELKTSRV